VHTAVYLNYGALVLEYVFVRSTIFAAQRMSAISCYLFQALEVENLE
jgi:hypothetical protein